jgi:hypothetical protein
VFAAASGQSVGGFREQAQSTKSESARFRIEMLKHPMYTIRVQVGQPLTHPLPVVCEQDIHHAPIGSVPLPENETTHLEP